MPITPLQGSIFYAGSQPDPPSPKRQTETGQIMARLAPRRSSPLRRSFGAAEPMVRRLFPGGGSLERTRLFPVSWENTANFRYSGANGTNGGLKRDRNLVATGLGRLRCRLAQPSWPHRQLALIIIPRCAPSAFLFRIRRGSSLALRFVPLELLFGSPFSFGFLCWFR